MKTAVKILFVGIICIAAIAVYYFYPDQPLPANARINKLVVWKSKRKMMAYQGESLLKTYTISLGKNPVGDKQVKDDKKRRKVDTSSMIEIRIVSVTKI